ncbi:DUF3267 domain-containing protein [Lysinibacillus endophyticus]|uniref:DUF3267 domain-containing protein n=1 Tax=Ureibacillus endophyticus TaxID=1978490 RepID=A0A494Z111_9BACL|nr:DUF3267 domain-containing protein [Lysinibacillus endophyticus]MCP1145866.1 DUF3267 domain-containing protein [Lysinibacillus endophyticus]RKQ16212.1 DUF3267 domain-containing protein [Lysinibacillus endophyticus]
MHCWKTINLKNEYGSTWLTIVSITIFIIIFSFTFVLFGQLHPSFYKDDWLWIFLIWGIFLYPLHKLTHYFSLFGYRKSVKLRIRRDFLIIPVLIMRIKKEIPKNRYIFTLLAPFIFINGFVISLILLFPQFTHFLCIILSYHCSICLIDILYVKDLISAPRDSVIEETPKGYEILVPTKF